MSHEIRTPLNGVLALAEVMDRQLRQEELRPYVGTIIQSGQTLLRLLNDALDLSRAEAGRLEQIKARGYLGCGVFPGVAGFATIKDGRYSGFDTDICRAVAAAIALSTD